MRDDGDPSYRPTSPSSSRARIASAVGRKTISRRFFGRFRSYSLHGRQRSATCLVEATVKSGRRRSRRGGEEGGGCRERKRNRERERRGGGGGELYGRSARLKFLHTNGWQTKEERAGGKNQGGRAGEKISLMPRRFARGTDECPATDDRQIRLGSLELAISRTSR